MPKPDTTERFALDEHHAAATAFNMVLVVWFKETQLQAFRRVCETLTRLAGVYPEGVGVCQVVGLQAVPPASDARAEITRLMRESIGGQLKHYSVVHEGTGFKAASVRAIVSASHMLARTRANLAVFNTIAEAAVWHSKQQHLLGRTESPQLISGLIYQLQQEYSKKYSKNPSLGTSAR